ncbi:MAG: glycosyltransferase [Gemmatimonadetes bacterium]|nr:glycosyltransferase [Gemmatimonadota bacterium]
MPAGTQIILSLPWVALLLMMPLMLLRRPRLTTFAPPPPGGAPLVSIIVPARNEAVNISVCLASLLNSDYPDFEIIVVNDGSSDGTEDIVRILAEHSEGRIHLIEGEPLPEGWLGKPWACWQGYQHAKGKLLLFTDADTRHEERLLGHAVGALLIRRADLVSVLPRQLMVGIWERLILPHIFALISLRFTNLERVNRTRVPRHVIANGQFMLVRRDVYESIGGHEALRAEIVEDQRFAQRMVIAGRQIFIAHAETLMETRMYRSLGGIIEGWTKNLATGSRQAAPEWAAPFVPWIIALFLTGMWVLPPLTLLLSLVTPLAGSVKGWSIAVTAASVVFWLIGYAIQRVPLLFALAYPIGAIAAAGIFIRSALRGRRVGWKGREYRMAPDGGAVERAQGV